MEPLLQYRDYPRVARGRRGLEEGNGVEMSCDLRSVKKVTVPILRDLCPSFAPPRKMTAQCPARKRILGKSEGKRAGSRLRRLPASEGCGPRATRTGPHFLNGSLSGKKASSPGRAVSL